MKFSLKSFLQGFGIIAIILTLLPLIAIDYWWIRVFDFPHVQLTGLTLAAFIAYFMTFDLKNYKDYLFITIVGACFLFQAYKVFPYTPLASYEIADSTPTDERNDFNIYSANVFQDNKEYDPLLKEIKSYDPDIILLMETNQEWKNAVHGTLSPDYPYQLLQPLDNTYGLLFYSRLPLSESKIRFLVDKEIPSIETRVTLRNGEKIQLYAIHPTPPMPQHNPMSSDRDTEMMKTAFQAKENGFPTVVIGDFNDVAWSDTTSLFRKVSGLLDPRIGRSLYNTFNAKNIFMRWPLDHLFTSPEFRVTTFETGDGINSDHFALHAVLTYEPSKSAEQDPIPATEEEVKRAREQLKEQNLLNMEL